MQRPRTPALERERNGSSIAHDGKTTSVDVDISLGEMSAPTITSPASLSTFGRACTAARSHPFQLIGAPLLVFCALTALSLGVAIDAANSLQKSKVLALQKRVDDAASLFGSALSGSMAPLFAVQSFVEHNPGGAAHSVVKAYWESASSALLALAPGVECVQLAPYGHVVAINPVITPALNLTGVLAQGGLDIFDGNAVPRFRPVGLHGLVTQQLVIDGPRPVFSCVGGTCGVGISPSFALLGRLPLFAPIGSSAWGDTTWPGLVGRSLGPFTQVTNCSQTNGDLLNPVTGLSLCAPNASGDGKQFWGFTTSIISWMTLLKISKIASLGESGLQWSISRTPVTDSVASSLDVFQYADSNSGVLPTLPYADGAVAYINAIGSRWVLSAQVPGGWDRRWEAGVDAACVVTSALLASALALYLFLHRRHSDMRNEALLAEVRAAATLEAVENRAALAAKEAATALEDEQGLMRTVLEQLPLGVFIIVPSKASVGSARGDTSVVRTETRLSNVLVREIWGAVETDSMFDNCINERTGNDGSHYACLGLRSLRYGEVIRDMEPCIESPGRPPRRIRVNSAPVIGADGKIIAAVVIMEDITRLRELEQLRLKHLEEEVAIKASSAAKNEFVANMSHELRTPIHGILGLSELLQQSLLQSRKVPERMSPVSSGTSLKDAGSSAIDEQLQYCHMIHESALLLKALVSNVLDYTKMDAGSMTLESIEIHLRDLFVHTVDLVRSLAVETGTTVSLLFAEDLPLILYGDPVRLQQILLNLTSNAIKFCSGTAGGGKVVVRVYLVAVIAHEGHCELCLEVEDNGPGVPPEVVGRLFKPFAQADSSTTRRFGGSGLGLWIVRGLCDMMHGSVSVRSPNAIGGATFRASVRLAIEQPQAASTAVNTALAASPDTATFGNGSAREQITETPTTELYRFNTSFDSSIPPRILVVEDNRVNRLIAERIFRKVGYDVCLAENGKGGVDAVQMATVPFNIIFMDCHMPVLDGFEATRAIRQLPGAFGRIPIVGLSASTLPEDIARCMAAGMNGYVAKPAGSDLLLNAVRRYASASQL